MSNGRSTPVRVSIRLRLTLWNASVLALLLSVFGVASWITMRGVLQARANTTVSESARAIAGAVLAERQGARRIADSTRVVRTAVRDALRELHIGDFDVLIVDDAARVVAANRVPTRRRTNTRPGAHIAPTPPVDPDTVALSPPVRELLRLKPLGNETLLRSLTIDDQIWRAALVRVGPGIVDSLEPALIVGVLRSDEEDVAVLDRVRTTLLLAIPFALAVTILAGYLLARRSLAPVEEMAASAARISAATLDERLPVSNPYDELGRLATVVNDLLARVDVAFRVQRQFVADASHELRTPIAIVRGEADVALQMPTRAEAEYRDALAIIRDESVRLSRIIDDLFLLARADAASPIHQRERVDIGELLAASVRSVRTIADDQHMRLTLEHAGDNRDAVFVDGDPVLLRRLLLNLLDNALKHTPRDGAISVSFRNTASHVVIVVADSGPGIPPELRPRIFDRFVRGAVDAGEGLSSGTSRVPTASGAGLGLAIAQAIAHAHGGQIVLDNTTTGAAFRVTLLRG